MENSPFLQFCPDLSKKSKSIKAIYIYAVDGSRYALSENGITYYAMTTVLEIWSRRIFKNFCWVNIFFDILIANISWTVGQTLINHIIFWKSVMKTLRCMYVNSFNRLRFLVEVSTKLQKCTFLDNLRIITQEGNMRTREMTSFFSSAFSALTVCNIYVCIWK